MQTLHQEYDQFLTHDTRKLAEAKKSIRNLAFLRFSAFAGMILSLVFLPKVSPALAWAAFLLLFVLFLYAIKCFIKKEKEKLFYSKLIQINRDEKLALDEVFEQFDPGAEFTDPDHSYSCDLDLFGIGSLFQSINRTTTPSGKIKLAAYLTNLVADADLIEQKQKALQELSDNTRWRQHFSAKGPGNHDQPLQFLGPTDDVVKLDNPSSLKRITILFPAFSIAILLLCIFSVLPWSAFALSATVNMLILYLYRKKIDSFYRLFGHQTMILENYLELFRLSEQKEFQSTLLNQIRQSFRHEGKSASQLIAGLQGVMSRFDYRSNVLFILTGELIFLSDLVCIYKLNQWQQKHRHHIIRWFEAIYELDALSSFANLNHNHPEWALPVPDRKDFCFAANDLAHPLIKPEKRIGNDFRMNGEGKVVIITGANMAGKSTFLRTIGVNVILAMNGCRVCASWMTLKPVYLFTNMRTTDNLRKEESYFFAELQRLKQMLTLIQKGIPLFIIIDEMLKGTNSKDKLSGSKALVEKLIRLQGNAVVATHDLSLTELAEIYPENIFNKCFEVHLSSEKWMFDYKLHDGITHTMNASFLMKKMGIID